MQERIAAHLADHPCVDCGERDVRCLEFDHRDPATKVAEVTTLLRLNADWARVQAEIAKCDVRCANCHRRVTVERGGWWRQAVYEELRAADSAASHPRLEAVRQPGSA